MGSVRVGTISVFGIGKLPFVIDDMDVGFGTISVFGIGKRPYDYYSIKAGFGTISVFGIGKPSMAREVVMTVMIIY